MTVTIKQGDCLEVLKTLGDDSFDSIVTDPPAGISFMGKEWDGDKGGRNQWIEWMASVMVEVLRVLKPGAHALVWALPRTSHWTATAIEDAGFEVRDVITHHFGSGFPKSRDVSKAIDKARDDTDQIRIVCRFLRTAIEESAHTATSVAELFDFHPRMVEHWAARDTDSQPTLPTTGQWGTLRDLLGFDGTVDELVSELNARKNQPGDAWSEARVLGQHSGQTPGFQGKRFSVRDRSIREATGEAQQWAGWGTALKPGSEHWILARKPLAGTVAANVLEHGTGGLNIDGCRVETGDKIVAFGSPKKSTGGILNVTQSDREQFEQHPQGRWPPNLLLTHSLVCGDVECAPCCPVREIGAQSGVISSGIMRAGQQRKASLGLGGYGDGFPDEATKNDTPGDTGTAARFFPTFRYEAKPSTAEKEAGCAHLKKDGAKRGNDHPTVKSIALMQWLCRLITPPGGIVLDLFYGSGTTGIAALREGFGIVGIEKEPRNVEIARSRIVADAPLLTKVAR